MSRSDFIFTSESVSEGHPDKVCDRISDEIVDLFFRKALAAGMDPSLVRVACETMTTTNRTCLSGEVRGPESILKPGTQDFTEDFKAEMEQTARNAVKSIGYNDAISRIKCKLVVNRSCRRIKVALHPVEKHLVDTHVARNAVI